MEINLNTIMFFLNTEDNTKGNSRFILRQNLRRRRKRGKSCGRLECKINSLHFGGRISSARAECGKIRVGIPKNFTVMW